LEAILRGRRELFEGLWIDGSDYDWTPQPVIRLDMAKVDSQSVATVNSSLFGFLNEISFNEDIVVNFKNIVVLFTNIIFRLYRKYDQKVAVLIDNYDAPILDQAGNPKLADGIRKALAIFYSALQGLEPELRFVLITGVGRFGKDRLAPKTLQDLTMDPKYGAVCGFTIEEFDSLFREAMENGVNDFKAGGGLPLEATVDDLRDRIIALCGGYSWNGKTRVLNPWSTLGCLKLRRLSGLWSQSSAPPFLIDLLKERRMYFDDYRSSQTIGKKSNHLEVNNIDPTRAMLQTGHLTIKSHVGSRVALDFPNLEVKASLLPRLMSIDWRLLANPLELSIHAKAMSAALLARDAEGLAAAFGSFLAIIPSKLHQPDASYFRTLLFTAMALAGQSVAIGQAPGHGRPGVVVTVEGPCSIFPLSLLVVELEYLETEGALAVAATEAMARVERTGYALEIERRRQTIHKATLVVSGRADAPRRIGSAPVLRLVENAGGHAVERTEPDQDSWGQPVKLQKPAGAMTTLGLQALRSGPRLMAAARAWP
jgi:hypothetical protein